MDKERIIGIYKITCTANNKFYIGSSLNIDERIYQHRCDLKNNRHHSAYMQRCYNKYGSKTFKVDILAQFSECTEDLLREVEYLFIIKLNPEFNYAAPCSHLHTSNLWRKKISESTKKLYTEKGYKNPRLGIGKRYDVYNYMGDKIAEHKTITEVATTVGVISYHSLNNGLRDNGITITRSLYGIIPEGKDIASIVMSNIELVKNRAVVETNGAIYKNPCTQYYQKGRPWGHGQKGIRFNEIRQNILQAENKYYIIDNRVFTLPFLSRFIEKSILKNT